MPFKQCFHKKDSKLAQHHIEYDDLEVRSKFVTTKHEIKKEKVPQPNGFLKLVVVAERTILRISYPDYSSPVFSILNQEKEKYYLVVNHTLKSAYPVEKDLFHQYYSNKAPTPGSKKEVKGDKLSPKHGKVPENTKAKLDPRG